MTDLETRKSAALKRLNSCGENIVGWYKDNEETIRELFAPSPQVPDSEVEKACELLDDEIYSEFGNSPLGMKLQNAVHILRKAAQHPQREECPDIKPELDFLAYLDDQWNFMAEKYPEDYYRYCAVFHGEVKKLMIRNTIPYPPKDAK